ncbi:XrtA-associated tyrosine autokinase [Desulfomicrobium sp. ZS1]|uniref:XrtA-associated tyrosine autokinase n=1 Tax=Desulfomicrobium sp. ZS1 TaxID=2952228 RepID=UPI0020B2CE76|nr:XrtA-associated tyrosine autokinase [Desulfomicrobium sp. ZS1]UTF50698.1 XrtA-associated tyrosine autokinase [Desulfomicrobium sp. ZS1]
MSRIEEALAKAAGMQSGLHGRGNRDAASGIARVPMGEPTSVGGVRLAEETMVVINAPLSPMAEEYRKLKEALVKMTKRERFDNLIAVTSSTVGEGKSMTAVNLAASLAGEYDHTVLLVDADLRRPAVHKYLGLGSCKGLSDCMREGLDVGELLVKTGIGKLSVLPAGTPTPNPVELFSSDAMRNLFREMKIRYGDRYIIVDTPPVLPFAETRSIASIVDGVILVVKEGMPSLEQIEEAIDALDQKVLGIVYNGAYLQSRSSYYYAE